MVSRRKDNNKSAGADLLLTSLDRLAAVQDELKQKRPGDSVDTFLEQHERANNIARPKAPLWVNWVFVPLIISAVAGAIHVLIFDKTANNSLKDKALSGLVAGLTGSIGFYAGKK
jgi:hypothetical protein